MTSAKSRTREANVAWEQAMTTHAVLMRTFAAHDVWCDLSVREYDVLYTLAKAKEPLRLSALGHGVLLSQPALSRMVDRLVSRGLISRCVDPADARATHLSLTPEGVALQRKIGRGHGAHVATVMQTAFTDEEIATFEALHRKLTAATLEMS